MPKDQDVMGQRRELGEGRFWLSMFTLIIVGFAFGWAIAEIFRDKNRRSSAISQRQADCVETGGAPVVIGYGHSHYRVMCFRPDAVLWTDSEFQSKGSDHD